MPKPLPTLSIAPSRLALTAHLGVWASVSGLAVSLGSAWLAGSIMVSGGLLMGLWWRGQRRWELRESVEGRHATWQWRRPGESWQVVHPAPVRVGAWLTGLRIGHRTLWLWPDSASATSRRLLRVRLLASMPQARR
ncbi:hypothetical protein [Chromohalobacter sp.]|uniref:hypothetical protein n=1 Tax=Chromohalobacter sp. TaxID=50740 RepID=UPI001D3ABBDB|nr:hypothetical protein [Chromohalobacter sp.]NQY46150.1 hypothetical protein [Chromohalobacter sp.]